MTETESAFWHDCEKLGTPGAQDARGIFADWLEDEGRTELAEAMRWCVREGKRPRRYSLHAAKYAWFRATLSFYYDALPAKVFSRISRKSRTYHGWIEYKTIQDAYSALAIALSKTKATAR